METVTGMSMTVTGIATSGRMATVVLHSALLFLVPTDSMPDAGAMSMEYGLKRPSLPQ